MMQITVISGDLETPGSVIEIPFCESNLGIGPIYEVDPKTRKSLKTLQRFEIADTNNGGAVSLVPIGRTDPENGLK